MGEFNRVFYWSASISQTDHNPDESLILILKKIIYLQTVFLWIADQIHLNESWNHSLYITQFIQNVSPCLQHFLLSTRFFILHKSKRMQRKEARELLISIFQSFINLWDTGSNIFKDLLIFRVEKDFTPNTLNCIPKQIGLGFIVIVDCPSRNRTSGRNSTYAHSSPSAFFDQFSACSQYVFFWSCKMIHEFTPWFWWLWFRRLWLWWFRRWWFLTENITGKIPHMTERTLGNTA